jgi:putative SOS response-associated peptidase YedK
VHVGMKDASLFAFGGLFERWRSDAGEVLDTCTIVTTEANSLLAAVHSRMPMIVAPENYARWLDPGNAEVADLVVPFPSDAMTWYPVSTRVNNVRHDDAALIESAEPVAVDAADGDAPPPAPEQESLF